jgi:hypothetical protein
VVSVVKSYKVFHDSTRGTTLNLHETAPTGGVVRCSLKSLQVNRDISNIPLRYRKSLHIGIVFGDDPVTLAFAVANVPLAELPVAIYETPIQVSEAVVQLMRDALAAYDPVGKIVSLGGGRYTLTSALLLSEGKGIALIPTPDASWLSFTNGNVIGSGLFAFDLSQVKLSAVGSRNAYLRLDTPTANFESQVVAATSIQYPPHMTSNTQTFTNLVHGNGTYTASASSSAGPNILPLTTMLFSGTCGPVPLAPTTKGPVLSSPTKGR